ncbi:hypothetical protein, partial [Klebsiella pneumoniae]|uniref:hypothetical protein n=1 Tax=Klebsiella pneumoniae TaxID=573 RepID=UPI003EE3084F
RVRAYVEECRGELVAEVVYLEAAADRGTEHVEPELLRALKACGKGGAQLLHVDFALHAGWRQHPFLARLM